jgi:uncharacterized phage-associated protein
MSLPDSTLVQRQSESKVADLVYQNISHFILAQKQQLVAQLVQSYRSGCVDAVVYSSKAAQIAALEDLETKLLSTIKRGNDAAKTLMERHDNVD